MMKKFLTILLALVICGCTSSTITSTRKDIQSGYLYKGLKLYEGSRDRVSILRTDFSDSPTITGVNGIPVLGNPDIFVLKPGKNHLSISTGKKSLYTVSSSVILESKAGHTYRLKTPFSMLVNADVFPEKIDVSGDPKLHILDLSSVYFGK